MHDCIIGTIEMSQPLLTDKDGIRLMGFNSASISLWDSGRKEIHTDPIFIADDIARDYCHHDSPPIFLSDANGAHRVVVRGGLLEIVDEEMVSEQE
jgi:hypothetical protein